MFTIGDFSRVCGLTVKTLRFYHEQGLLIPSSVDPQTGYRRYDAAQVETARLIAQLRKLEFPLADIHELLKHSSDEDELLRIAAQHKSVLAERVRTYSKAIKSLERFISEERQARTMAQSTVDVQEKTLEPVLVGGIRIKGRYADCGKAFARIGRDLGRHICGKPLLLHYDDEYKEEDADFEACMPIRKTKAIPDVCIKELPGGRCVCLLHSGPYEQLGRSYAKILRHVHEACLRIIMPTREVYLKGPGMIFKGNPAHYLTEIQMLVEPMEPTNGGRNETAAS